MNVLGCGAQASLAMDSLITSWQMVRKSLFVKLVFLPRKSALTFYLGRFPGKPALMKKLGKHRTSKACLYINKLDDVDLNVLKKIIDGAYKQPDDGKGC